MQKSTLPGTADVPRRLTSLAELREAVNTCRNCPLWENATQGVPGEGASKARILFVGEQPGDKEDLAGHPFVGPAGRVLDDALEQAGIDRAKVFVTNIVKHFSWLPRGKRRLHKKPTGREIAGCIGWLHEEVRLVRPSIIVCLGATATQAILGSDIKVTLARGQFFPSEWAERVLVTVHPSSILRGEPEDRARALAQFVSDLAKLNK